MLMKMCVFELLFDKCFGDFTSPYGRFVVCNCTEYARVRFKAMLHEAIFLATCLATMTTEKHCKLQRGCHSFAIFFRNL